MTAPGTDVNCRILQGDVFDMLPTIERSSVDCVVTSPPYWALRSYLPKGHPLKHLELGQEKSPAEYVARMVEVMRLVRDCMADHATLWLNVGDTYSGSGQGGGGGSLTERNGSGVVGKSMRQGAPGIDSGNLCLIPQRLMIALQDDGWYVRSVVVWHKPAPMPTSVTGWMWRRCRVKVKAQGKVMNHRRSASGGNPSPPHPDNGIIRDSAQWSDCPGCPKCEKTDGLVLRRGSWRPTSAWEPIIMLAKSAKYYADGEAVKTASQGASPRQFVRKSTDAYGLEELTGNMADGVEWVDNGGANLRDVWLIASEALKEKHYAAYPSELVYRCLAAGTSAEGYCVKCGKPWVRVVETQFYGDCRAGRRANDAYEGKHEWRGTADVPDYQPPKTVGWRASCSCEAPTRPGLVLDPFAGSGRTAIVARRLQLDFVGCELNPEYVEMGKRLVKADAPLFNTVED